MKQYYPFIGLERLCRLFGKTRQAFYEHGWRDVNEQFNEGIIIDKVRSLRQQMPGIGGLPLHRLLKQEMALHGMAIGRDRFYLLLKSIICLLNAKNAL